MNNGDIQLEYYIVVFLDLLGQDAKLRDFPDIVFETRKTDIIDPIKETYTKVIHLREHFNDFYENHNSNCQNKADILWYGISDSIIIAIPLKNSHCEAINGIFKSLFALSGAMIFSLSDKTALRGGMDIGSAAIINEKEIYGPALARAVHLEKKVAKYPRIVVGDRMIEYLDVQSNIDVTNKKDELIRENAKWCRGVLSKDTDGAYIVDYLSENLQHLIQQELVKHDINNALCFVKDEIKRFQNENNHKLTERYQQLFDYIISRNKKL